MRAARAAAVYARISLDRTGEGLGVQRQVKACRQKAEALGWQVAAEYIDNDRSATSGRPRPQYEAMMGDLRAGRVDAVVCWAVDRLSRTPIELEHLIALAQDTGVQLATCSGDIDLGTDTGQLMARVMGAFARGETDRKAARQRAANDQRAEAGIPYRTQRPFGYEEDAVTIHEAEAAELRRLAEKVLAGRSLRSLAKELNERGVTTAQGNQWRPATLKQVLVSPRNAGLRQHRGQVIGAASWPPIFDETTATALRARLTDPSRSKKGRPREYLLSGIIWCGRCGAHMVGTHRDDRGRCYRCSKELHLVRQAGPVEEVIEGLVVGRLSSPDAADLFARADHSQELARLRGELSGARSRMDALAEAFAAGDIDRQALQAGSRRLAERTTLLEGRIGDLAATPALSQIAAAKDVAEAFAALPMETRRAVIEALVRVTVEPVGHRRGPVQDGLTIVWRSQ